MVQLLTFGVCEIKLNLSYFAVLMFVSLTGRSISEYVFILFCYLKSIMLYFLKFEKMRKNRLNKEEREKKER